MKILVLSDSHSSLSMARRAIWAVRPDVIVHLGDYYDDGQAIARENPEIPFHQVPGNCDRFRMMCNAPETLCYDVCGVRLFMTHGHNYWVKQGTGGLLRAARTEGAAAVLYGHTHTADCRRESDGLWVLNPGSCSHFGGSCGLIETDGQKITACRILRQADMEEMQ